MQVSSTNSFPMIDRGQAQRQLNELAIDLSRNDAKIEGIVRNGNSVGSGWGEWFDRTSAQLLEGRDAYMALNPHDRELAARFGAELLEFTSDGGRIASAQDRGATLGSSWMTALDGTIAVVQEASNRLYGAPNQPFPGQPGFPGDPDGPAWPAPGQPGEEPGVPPVGSVPPASDIQGTVALAAELVTQSIGRVRALPANDTGSDATKQARIEAHRMNMQAQQVLEPLFTNQDQNLVSQLRSADAHLEDANWQLAKKPSPDGRFNGVDIPGALRSSEQALQLLEQVG